MREILFRGKRIDNGEWVEGSFIIESLRHGNSFSINVLNGDLDGDDCLCQIHPETVGQFTGLSDKNGKKIFEGDIVSVRGTKRVGIYKTVVIYESQGFCLKENKTYLNKYMERVAIQYIIGNIHDNPELI